MVSLNDLYEVPSPSSLILNSSRLRLFCAETLARVWFSSESLIFIPALSAIWSWISSMMSLSSTCSSIKLRGGSSALSFFSLCKISSTLEFN